MNSYIIYQKQGKTQKYRTFKSYTKYKLRSFATAKFNRLSAFIGAKTDKPLNIVVNA